MTVRSGAAREPVPLHHTLKAAALGAAGHPHRLPGREELDREPLARALYLSVNGVAAAMQSTG